MSDIGTPPYEFKLGMCLEELTPWEPKLPFDKALEIASEIGARYVWFDLAWAAPDLDDAGIRALPSRLAKHGLEMFMVHHESPFSRIHVSDLELDTMQDDPEVSADFGHLVKAMQVAGEVGVREVLAYPFAWTGEYSAAKPTWPMRWLTRGGVIADSDMGKLVKAFSLATEEAKKYGVDVVLGMLPWHYANTTANLRRIAETVGSPKLKAMWGPADSHNCGEWDVATSGFANIRPYLRSLHIKDLAVFDGLSRNFEYRALGDGDVDYMTILRNMRYHHSQAVLAVATHYRPPGGIGIDAMKLNFSRLQEMVREVEAEQPRSTTTLDRAGSPGSAAP